MDWSLGRIAPPTLSIPLFRLCDVVLAPVLRRLACPPSFKPAAFSSSGNANMTRAEGLKVQLDSSPETREPRRTCSAVCVNAMPDFASCIM